ncbi:MAG TPA: ABC transporter substrate-binding protein [Bellilinea sp.]|nr:ABC transporter substrate-binding protein [Bellilinea sp.]
MNRLLTSLFLLFLILAACAPQSAPLTPPTPIAPPQPFVFMAGYKPQANLPFVGVYVAKEKGFFAEEGLDVTVEHSPGQGQHMQLLVAGKVQITTQDASVLLQRRGDPGLPVVSIALIGQKGQQAYAALADKSFTSPKDWEGHIVGYKGTQPPDLSAVIKAAGGDATKMQIVNVGFDPRLLTEGKVDVYPVFKSNEPFLIKSWGYEIKTWEASDFDLPNLGLTYVTSEDTLKTRPGDLEKFLRASLRGIEYAEANVNEAVDYVMKYTGPETNREHMKFMLETELKDAHSPVTDKYGMGYQTADQWRALTDFLIAEGFIKPQDYQKAFTTSILDAARRK